ncbi:MAG: ABC transporter permease subunit/CPBP intramembrane protease [Planctomycetota bacterium]
MNYNNVKLIFLREMRDQLRDRRTLFLIAVLPLLLYPLLGMSFFQLSQFLRNTAAKVLVVGEQELANREWLPQLLAEEQFDQALFVQHPDELASLKLVDAASLQSKDSASPDSFDPESLEFARDKLDSGAVQLVLYFPPGFGDRLEDARAALIQRGGDVATANEAVLPEPQLFYNSAKEKSRVAQMRVERLLRLWRNSVMRTNLRAGNVPLAAAQPFELQPQDVAEEQQRHAAVWSKILPFILFIWALTGAFYPAVDLCAGEKERGTLETLLASPAQRREIVWGKLLTVITFSVVTALLNLGSMGLTGKFVLAQFQQMSSFSGAGALALPPTSSLVWLILALLPISALFSALCLACAALARSTKEGQYYLMPLLLIVMPLMMLPLSPGVELTLGNSLIPVTGVVLLLRSMIEGQYWEVLPYVVPVCGVTSICVLLAIRWAQEQFESESVLFRESERLDLGRWLVHLVRDRGETPTFAQGILCVGAILVVQFFVTMATSAQAVEAAKEGINFRFLLGAMFNSQVVCILVPAAMFTLLFTSNKKKTLLLDHLPSLPLVLMTTLLAIAVRPLGMVFAEWVLWIYPPTAGMESQLNLMQEAFGTIPNWWMLIALMALLPAVCEEIAFRGFVLSGLRHVGHKWWAIGLSAVAFGLVHTIFQQQIGAAAVGLVLGYLAIQTGNLMLCMLFHAVYNGLGLYLAEVISSAEAPAGSSLGWLLSGDRTIFEPWVLVVSFLGAAVILRWLHHLPYQRTKEEKLHEAREHRLVGA